MEMTTAATTAPAPVTTTNWIRGRDGGNNGSVGGHGGGGCGGGRGDDGGGGHDKLDRMPRRWMNTVVDLPHRHHGSVGQLATAGIWPCPMEIHGLGSRFDPGVITGG